LIFKLYYERDGRTYLQAPNPNLVLSTEQLSNDAQQVVDNYLRGTIDEETLMTQAHAWENYKRSHRPLIESPRTTAFPLSPPTRPTQNEGRQPDYDGRD
jgi:hypothetical protein